jgi:hypothetical protein
MCKNSTPIDEEYVLFNILIISFKVAVSKPRLPSTKISLSRSLSENPYDF